MLRVKERSYYGARETLSVRFPDAAARLDSSVCSANPATVRRMLLAAGFTRSIGPMGLPLSRLGTVGVAVRAERQIGRILTDIALFDALYRAWSLDVGVEVVACSDIEGCVRMLEESGLEPRALPLDLLFVEDAL